MVNYIEFLEKYKNVKIPKLQREFVHGRNKNGLRLMDSLFNKLNCSETIVLDLIYGEVEVNRDERIFKPIDGQQRLTDLFLLYWYVIKMEGWDNESDSCLDKYSNSWINLKKFTYDTRISSKEFCKALVNEKVLIKKDEKPSKVIRKCPWYFSKYDRDYTVQCMLAMLNKISELYSKISNASLYDKMNEFIKFNELDLGKYKQGEELYIIMNDRGKQLTAYENLKSFLDDWMKKHEFFKNKEKDESGIEKEKWLLFSEKMDNVWAENIWCKCGRDNKKADSVMYLFFCRYFCALFAAAMEKKEKPEKDEIVQILYNQNEKDYESKVFKTVFDTVVKNEGSEEKFYADLVCFLDFWLGDDKDNSEVYKDFLKPIWKNSKDDDALVGVLEAEDVYITEATKRKNEKINYSLPSRVVNFALQLYVCNHSKYETIDINDSVYINWKRFTWNLIENADVSRAIENAYDVMQVLYSYRNDIERLIDAISEKHKDIDNESEDKKESHIKAEKYEIRKAQYIKEVIGNCEDSDEWKKALFEIEKHQYLRGYIDFLIMDKNGNLLKNDTKEDFEKRTNNAKYIFDRDGQDGIGINPDKNHLIVRALLSKSLHYDLKIKGQKKNTLNDFNLIISDREMKEGNLMTQIKNIWSPHITKYISDCDTVKVMVKKMEADCNVENVYNRNIIYNIEVVKEDDANKINDMAAGCYDKLKKWQQILSKNPDIINWLLHLSDKGYGATLFQNLSDESVCIKLKLSSTDWYVWLRDDLSDVVKLLEDGKIAVHKPGFYEKEEKVLCKSVVVDSKDCWLFLSSKDNIGFYGKLENEDGKEIKNIKYLFDDKKVEYECIGEKNHLSVDEFVEKYLNNGK